VRPISIDLLTVYLDVRHFQLDLRPFRLELRPFRLELWPFRLELWPFRLELRHFRLELRHFRLELRPFRLELRPFRLDLRPVRLDLRPFRLELRHFRLELRPFRLELRHFRLELWPFRLDLRAFAVRTRPGIRSFRRGISRSTRRRKKLPASPSIGGPVYQSIIGAGEAVAEEGGLSTTTFRRAEGEVAALTISALLAGVRLREGHQRHRGQAPLSSRRAGARSCARPRTSPAPPARSGG